MRRDVNSSVSALTVSCAAGASSSSASGGSGESGRSRKSGRCFSFTTRSDFGTSTTCGTTSTGSRRTTSCFACTTASRIASACAPSSRSLRSSARRLSQMTARSSQVPMRSISFSHDSPKNSDEPAANSVSSSSVAPLNPRSFDSPRPRISPSAPPAACGSVTGRLYRRSASSAALDSNTSANPSTPSERGWSVSSSGCPMRRYPATTSTTPATTHHHAEMPKR